MYMQNTGRVDTLPYTFGLECEVADRIVYDPRSKVKPWPDSIVYQLITFFGSVTLRTAHLVACNFVYLFRKKIDLFHRSYFTVRECSITHSTNHCRRQVVLSLLTNQIWEIHADCICFFVHNQYWFSYFY